MRIHAVVAAGDHYYLILTPDDVDQVADFMDLANGNQRIVVLAAWGSMWISFPRGESWRNDADQSDGAHGLRRSSSVVRPKTRWKPS